MHFLAWWGMGNRFSIKINFNYFSLNDWQTVFCGESSSSVALLWPHNNSRFIHYAGKIKQRVDGVEPGTQIRTYKYLLIRTERENLFGKIKPEMNAATTITVTVTSASAFTLKATVITADMSSSSQSNTTEHRRKLSESFTPATM